MKILPTSVALVLVMMSIVTLTPSLCADHGGYPSDHTMVLFPGPSQECEQKQVLVGLTPDMQDFMVFLHNEKREEYAAKDIGLFNKGMTQLVWNNELASSAQRWADQCRFGNDRRRSTLDGFSSVDQNVYLGYSHAFTVGQLNAVDRDPKLLKLDIGRSVEWYGRMNVEFDLGNVHAKVNVGPEFDKLMDRQGVFKAGTVGILDEENSNFDQVQHLLSGIGREIALGDKLEHALGNPKVKTTRGDLVVELLPRVDNEEEDFVELLEHVDCIFERDGRDLVVEVDVSGGCHDVLFDWGDVDIDLTLGDHAVDIFDKIGVVTEGTTGVLTEANSNIEFIEQLAREVHWETKLGEDLEELMGHPEVETIFNFVERNTVAANEQQAMTKEELDSIFNRAVRSWFAESVLAGGLDHILVSRNKLTLGDGSQVSQLQYADTRYVGCGLSMFKEPSYPDWYYTLLVCNYAYV